MSGVGPDVGLLILRVGLAALLCGHSAQKLLGWFRSGHLNPVPRVVGPIERPAPVLVEDLRFLRAHRPPGPFTMAQQAQNDYYADQEQLAYAYAEAVNIEVHDLFAVGADIVQLDEPYRASWTCPPRRSRAPRSWPAGCVPRCGTSRRAGRDRHRLRHEVPPARVGDGQDAGHGRRPVAGRHGPRRVAP